MEDINDEKERWYKLFRLSQSGMYFESIGDLDKSIEIYESCIEQGWEGSHVYHKLSIFYKKKKQYKDVERVIKIYLKIHTDWFIRSNFHHTTKMEDNTTYISFKKRLDSIQKYL
jgi:hypothetical protein